VVLYWLIGFDILLLCFNMAEDSSDASSALRSLAVVAILQDGTSQATNDLTTPTLKISKVASSDSTTLEAKSIDGKLVIQESEEKSAFHFDVKPISNDIDDVGEERIRDEMNSVTQYYQKHALGTVRNQRVIVGTTGNHATVDMESASTPTSISTGLAVESLLEMKDVKKDVKKVLIPDEVETKEIAHTKPMASPTKQTPEEMAAELDQVNSFDSSLVPWGTRPDPTVSTPTKVSSVVFEGMVGSSIVAGRIKDRFPKMKSMLPQLVEFLTQTTTDEHLGPSMHPTVLLSNPNVTALPLIYFTNLIFSQTLLVNVASKTFNPPIRKSGYVRPSDVNNILGMAVPLMEKVPGKYSCYQFWLVHLNGRTGNTFMEGLHVNERSILYKFHDMFVSFFRSQFNELRPDEEKNIRDGFTSNCDTIYIAGFNATNQKSPQILASIQYASTPVGSWINWLGVSGAIPEMFLSEDGSPRSFRGLGLGMFLQILVQFQQLSRGWNPRLFLQTLLSGDACSYYLKRGYHRAPTNVITSIPEIEHSPFTTHHVHIMTDEFQVVEGTLPKDFVFLHFINGFVITTFPGDGHSFFFLDGEVMDGFPKNKDNLMVATVPLQYCGTTYGEMSFW
jgi:hypothetical protein